MVEVQALFRRFIRLLITGIINLSFAVVLTATVITGELPGFGLVEVNAQEMDMPDSNSGEPAAAAVSGYFTEIISRLDDYAGSADLVALFESGDWDSLDDEADRALAQFGFGLKLRLLIPGNYEMDTSSIPPLGYASLDILRHAESSDTEIAPEMLMQGTENEHVVLVRRVKNASDEIVGLVHLSMSVDIFNEAMSSVSVEDGYYELQQTIAGNTLILASGGDNSLKQSDPVLTSIEGTDWKLAFWPQGSVSVLPSTEGLNGITGYAVAGVIVLILAGVILFLISTRSGSAKLPPQETSKSEASIVFAGAIKAIMEGAHPGMEKLIPNLASIQAGKGGKITPLSTGMTGDDITMIAGKNDLKKAAEDGDFFDLTQEQGATPESETVTQPKAKQAIDSESVTDPHMRVADFQRTPDTEASVELSPTIFRTYDIRGIVGRDLTPETVKQIGQSIGSEAAAREQKKVAVGRDGRTSSPELAESLIAGLRAAGRDVVDIGMVPTPVLYFATHTLDTTSGVMLTGSHNGPEYNGLKIVLGGETLSEQAIRGIYDRIVENNFESGKGGLETRDITADYIRRISEDIPVALGGAFKLVVDCGNGVAGALAPQLYRALGHDVIELYCEVDGSFPNHHPDPSQPENLKDLIDRVREEGADLGFAFDGDADRLGVVDSQGNVIWPDRQMMLLARDVLSRNAGAEIIYDVKCSRNLKKIIESSGGKPLMWKTGHSLIKSKMKEVGAPLAGEMSGHIFFKERWYGFDDALYTGARMLEILMNAKAKPVDVFAEIPDAVSTPELRVDLPEDVHKTFMGDLQDKVAFDDAEIYDIDGFRVEFPDGWGLVRPSNTTPCLVLRFEADNEAALKRIQSEFSKMLLAVNPDLSLPF